jgi:lipopolysaccharide/colanic/teichoic acid biosynthesis glycosyltransferase
VEGIMYSKYIKRIFDLILSILLLPFLFLIVIIVGPIIYFTDKGNVFYNAERVGQNGKLFKMYKFRSMVLNAPDIRLSDGSTYNSENDSRVTKIGRFIRKTSIDEIPQILNILKGNMSFIGPRPDPPDWLEKYPEDVKIFLSMKPGITGYSQAYYRNSVDGEEKMKHDVYYSLNCSFILDIKIFFKTIVVVLKRNNMFKETEEDTSL